MSTEVETYLRMGNTEWALDAAGTLVISRVAGTDGVCGVPADIIGKGFDSQVEALAHIRDNATRVEVRPVWSAEEGEWQGCSMPRVADGLFEGFVNLRAADLAHMDGSSTWSMRRLFAGAERLAWVRPWRDEGGLDADRDVDCHRMFDYACVNGVPDDPLPAYASRERDIERQTRDEGNVYLHDGVWWIFRGRELTVEVYGGNSRDKDFTYPSQLPEEMTDMVSDVYYKGGLDTVPQLADVTNLGLRNVRRVDLEQFELGHVASATSAFRGMSRLEGVTYGLNDLSGVTSTKLMYAGCGRLVDDGLANCDLSEVVLADRMYEGCRSMATIDLTHTGMGPNVVSCADIVDAGREDDLVVGRELAKRLWRQTGRVAKGHEVADFADDAQARDLAGLVEPYCKDINEACRQIGLGSAMATAEVVGNETHMVIGTGTHAEQRFLVHDEGDLEHVATAAMVAETVMRATTERVMLAIENDEVEYLRYNPEELGTTASHKADVVENAVSLTPQDTADEYATTNRDMNTLRMEHNAPKEAARTAGGRRGI